MILVSYEPHEKIYHDFKSHQQSSSSHVGWGPPEYIFGQARSWTNQGLNSKTINESNLTTTVTTNYQQEKRPMGQIQRFTKYGGAMPKFPETSLFVP